MTIKEAEKLGVMDDNKTLRKPRLGKVKTEQQLEQILDLQEVLYSLFDEPQRLKSLLLKCYFRRRDYKRALKSMEMVEDVTGEGSIKSPYVLTIKQPKGVINLFTKGLIFDLRCLFKKGFDANKFVENHCYSNAEEAVKAFVEAGFECKQVTGIIMSKNKINEINSYLHSVAIFKGKDGQYKDKSFVIDGDMSCVMEEDLYKEITLFEPLCEIAGADLVNSDNQKLVDIYSAYRWRKHHYAKKNNMNDIKLIEYLKECHNNLLTDRVLALAYYDILKEAKKHLPMKFEAKNKYDL